MVTIDLKDTFFSIPINQEHQKSLKRLSYQKYINTQGCTMVMGQPYTSS